MKRKLFQIPQLGEYQMKVYKKEDQNASPQENDCNISRADVHAVWHIQTAPLLSAMVSDAKDIFRLKREKSW